MVLTAAATTAPSSAAQTDGNTAWEEEQERSYFYGYNYCHVQLNCNRASQTDIHLHSVQL